MFTEHVANYELAFSNDGSTWKNYEENGRSRVRLSFYKELNIIWASCLLKQNTVKFRK